MSLNSPDAQPGQSKEPEGPFVEKDMTQGSQTAPSGPAKLEADPASTADKSGSEPVVASVGEQEKRPKDAQAAMSTPATDSPAPVSAPPTSDKRVPPTSDSTVARPPAVPATSDQTTVTSATLKRDPTPNPGQSQEPEKTEEPAPSTTTGGPAEQPSSGASRTTDRQRELQRRRALKIHTRVAKFFAWILLLGFVILPGTFSRLQPSNNGQLGTTSGGSNVDQIANLPLLPIGYFCCFVNACAVCRLWYLRSDDPDWLYVNLFSAGLANSFFGLITALVNIYAAQGGTYGAASTSTLTLVAVCTTVYAVLTVIFYRKRIQARGRRNSGIV